MTVEEADTLLAVDTDLAEAMAHLEEGMDLDLAAVTDLDLEEGLDLDVEDQCLEADRRECVARPLLAGMKTTKTGEALVLEVQ